MRVDARAPRAEASAVLEISADRLVGLHRGLRPVHGAVRVAAVIAEARALRESWEGRSSSVVGAVGSFQVRERKEMQPVRVARRRRARPRAIDAIRFGAMTYLQEIPAHLRPADDGLRHRRRGRGDDGLDRRHHSSPGKADRRSIPTRAAVLRYPAPRTRGWNDERATGTRRSRDVLARLTSARERRRSTRARPHCEARAAGDRPRGAKRL